MFVVTWAIHVKAIGARIIPRNAHTLLGPSGRSGDQPSSSCWCIRSSMTPPPIQEESPSLSLSHAVGFLFYYYFSFTPSRRPSPHLCQPHPSDPSTGHTPASPVVGMSEDTSRTPQQTPSSSSLVISSSNKGVKIKKYIKNI